MRKIIVIGATSGIGKTLVEQYAAKGYTVGATGRRTALLEELKRNNDNVYIKSFDVLADNSTQKLQELIDEMGGGIDVAIISSGFGKVNRELSWEIENQIAQVNVVGFTRMCDYLFGYFCQQGYGHLAAISSIASIRGLDLSPAYSASKAYISIYLEALRRKVVKSKHKKVKVTTIIPGFIKTPFINENTPTFWMADVQKAVKQMVRGLERKKRKLYVTRRWKILVILNRWIPSYLYEHL